MDPVLMDLNQHLKDYDAAEARGYAAELLLEDADWVRETINEFALNVDWEWIAALCRAVQSGRDTAAMLDELGKRIDKHLEEEARG